ncbi:PhoH family protein [Acetobacterium carbinolicum]|jgi:PhoH-like ATPase|uniref:PhoH family protein n=1 Tax=Acetobacterium TaxID=33951 RepID=UPI000DBEAF5D|nr:PhoH family protein [Acetobacterium sp. KB-1]AWW27565.1 PhoH family protein [Acetobacterium sp. KB-1]MDK2936385.1 PhoH-like ATPase [Eubacteriaceae bacterium]MDK2961489.1 PhoH-like ATPase [Eubacteriaceae bacterium]
MPKTYVLDTNVLIQSPHALFAFEDNRIVLPIAVLEDLDKLKNEDGERGANSRQSIRFLEQLRQRGNLFEGVSLDNGGTVKIEANFASIDLPYGFQSNSNDNRILKVCKGLINQDEPVTLITKDILLRLKSQMLSIPTEDFTAEQSPLLQDQYTGRMEVYVPDEKMEDLKKKGIAIENLYYLDAHKNKTAVVPEYNQFFIIHSDINERKTLLGRYNGKKIVGLKSQNQEPFGVKPKNVGQRFLQEALMQDAETAPLVIVKGTAGTAKTFYSLAVGLHQTLDPDFTGYRKILVTRPNVQFDDEIGFLPGNEQEKIAPLLRPIIDNLEVLMDRSDKSRFQNEIEMRKKIEELFERGIITAEAMNFIRGRSITHTYLIIDEAQNLTPKQVKGIITRVGKGTKVILLGDPQQIDHPLLDEKTNGLSYASDRMKGSPLCFQLTMHADECLRSALAFDATQRM